jgi:hypothetical protein
LARIGPAASAAAKALSTAATDTDTDVRNAAAAALEQLGRAKPPTEPTPAPGPPETSAPQPAATRRRRVGPCPRRFARPAAAPAVPRPARAPRAGLAPPARAAAVPDETGGDPVDPRCGHGALALPQQARDDAGSRRITGSASHHPDAAARADACPDVRGSRNCPVASGNLATGAPTHGRADACAFPLALASAQADVGGDLSPHHGRPGPASGHDSPPRVRGTGPHAGAGGRAQPGSDGRGLAETSCAQPRRSRTPAVRALSAASLPGDRTEARPQGPRPAALAR